MDRTDPLRGQTEREGVSTLWGSRLDRQAPLSWHQPETPLCSPSPPQDWVPMEARPGLVTKARPHLMFLDLFLYKSTFSLLNSTNR